jgi:hypothetical protein
MHSKLGPLELGDPNQNQTTNLSTYFLHNESIKLDKNKQNL